MDPTEEITIELGEDGTGVIADAPVVVVVPDAAAAAVLTDDPAAGVEALKRQLADAEEGRRLAQSNAAQEATARADAERRATANAEQARRAEILAGDSQFDSISNALTASNRELENLQSLKATALEAGNYAEEARLAGEIAKAGARVVNLEAGKAAIEQQRKAAADAPPAAQQPAQQVQTPQQQQEAFLAGLPARTADWVRAHPQFFTDNAYQRKVMNAAAYAETSLGLNHTSDDYFKFIDGQSITPAAAPVSAAATPVQDRSSAPAKPAPVAAAPSRSVPDMGGGQSSKRSVTLSPQEREMARIMHPKLKPTDPDPEVIYARNKLALIEEGVIGNRQH